MRPNPPTEATSYTRWSPRQLAILPAVSGDECIGALVACGWRIVEQTEHMCRLVRAGETLAVPRDPIIDATWLMALLDAARLTAHEFVDALDRSAK